MSSSVFIGWNKARTGSRAGLGLAISKAIVEAHHGTIAVQSVGGGRDETSTVRFPPV